MKKQRPDSANRQHAGTAWTKSHQLEGDGLLTLLYHHLWKKNKSFQSCPGIKLPDTVVYEHNFPRAWYTYEFKVCSFGIFSLQVSYLAIKKKKKKHRIPKYRREQVGFWTPTTYTMLSVRLRVLIFVRNICLLLKESMGSLHQLSL